ncbi:hypothetical protein CTheo_965 [Ceratobasidium theobromae]|uniref:BRCT domain-containing protein n=1 Tax=Ceratobasidium theobromae TaxID=1582974 RepID=A0A5N5QV04_9AGAM|nr:hypothetical protein CTheo_965 [Ceratobasidium theobromae]
MEKYLSTSKYRASSQPVKAERNISSSGAARHHPYSRPTTTAKQPPKQGPTDPPRCIVNARSEEAKPKVSARKITLALLSTLKDEDNPITHSTSYLRTEHIVSCASGHQVNDSGNRCASYAKARNAILESQALEHVQVASKAVFRGLVIYVNGYCRGTTDTEIKRLVVAGGGKISYHNHGGVTHIVTSMQLSGKKTERMKNVKARRLTHVVTPDWIKDCYDQGKLLQEWKYNVIDFKNDTHVTG